MATMQAAVQKADPYLLAGGAVMDPLNNGYYGTAYQSNGDPATLGDGLGLGNFGLTDVPWYVKQDSAGARGQAAYGTDATAFDAWLKENNYQLVQGNWMDQPIEGGSGRGYYRGIVDSAGNVVGTPSYFNHSENVSGFQDQLKLVGAFAGGAALNGMTGTETLSGMDLAADAAVGGNSLAGAAANLGSGAAAASTTTTAATGGTYWNPSTGTFTGSAPAAGSSNLGATAMGVSDWTSLLNTGLNIYGMTQAGNAAEGATAAASAVAQGQLALSKEALDWYKKTYADEAPTRQAAADRQNAISDAQLKGMNFAIGQAEELDAYNKATFRPVEQRLVQEAQAYDTPERRAAAAASAAADVDVSAAATRQANDRALARAGVAPGSAKAMAIAEDAAVKQSVGRGASMTNAVRQTEQQGYARMADVANLGKGIATQQATQQGIASTSGNSSAATAGQALGSATSGTSLMNTGFQTASNAANSAGNLFNSVASSQRQDDQLLMTSIGQIGKSYAISDKGKKKGTGKMADAAQALKEVEATPVHEGWQYDPAKGGPDDGGQPHTGPMAQDVRRTMGDKAAPGGKAIDLVSLNGKMMAAIQALAKDVKALKRAEAKDEELEAA